MGVIKRGTGKYELFWTNEHGVERRKTMTDVTKEEAEAWLDRERNLVRDIKAGHTVRQTNPFGLDVAELGGRYIKGRDKKLKNAVTNHVIKTPLGAVKLERVTPALLLNHLEGLQPMPPKREGQKPRATVLSPRTRNHVRKHLVQLFEYALAHGLYVGTNPVHAVKMKKVKRKKLKTLTREESARLIATTSHPWRGILAVALHGLRKGEIWGLDVADVDLERNELRVSRSHDEDLTKNGRERIVPIFPTLRGAVADAVTLAKAESSAVLFPGRAGKRRHPDAAAEEPFRKALADAKIARVIRFHDMRHTAATLMLQARVPIERVSKILGHSSIAITMDLYGHLLVGDLHEAIAAVSFDLPATRAVGNA